MVSAISMVKTRKIKRVTVMPMRIILNIVRMRAWVVAEAVDMEEEAAEEGVITSSFPDRHE
jgi:hypothetical protein